MTVLFLWGAQPGDAARLPHKQFSDVVTFLNGDRLSGRLDHMAGGTIFFKTEGAGELKLSWGKIKKLHVPETFAVIPVGSHVRLGHPDKNIFLGAFDVSREKLTVYTPAGEERIPLKKIAYLVALADYRAALDSLPGALHGWKGSVTAGASIVDSSQNMSTYNSGMSLVRSSPEVPWMAPDDRSILGFSSTYGSISQANTPTISTSIFHGSAEQDQYLTEDLYVLAQAVFDQNSTQGLVLQQLYGGGVGYTVLKKPRQELDITLTLDYIKQQFLVASGNQNLIGGNFSTTYFYKFPRISINFPGIFSCRKALPSCLRLIIRGPIQRI